MEIENRFTAGVPPEELFEALLDMDRVARCMPGATLEGRDGDSYRGRLRSKVGPVSAEYAGTLRFAEVDRAERHAVIEASGQEVNGQGTASATVTADVLDHAVGGEVVIKTAMHLQGTVAQFGRGVLTDVSRSIVDQFARNLQDDVSGQEPTGSRKGASLSVPVWPVLKRALPVLLVVAIVAWVIVRSL